MTRLSRRSLIVFGVLVVLTMGVPMAGLIYVGLTQTPVDAEGHPLVDKAHPPIENGVVILSPQQGAVLPDGEVRVRLKLALGDVKLAKAKDVPQNRAENLVHIHAVLDTGSYDTPKQSSSTLFKREESAGKYSALVGPTLTYQGVKPGHHALRVEVVANDHNPAASVAAAAVEFEVR